LVSEQVFLLDICGKLQDPRIGLKRSRRNHSHGGQSVHIDPREPTEEIFERLEAQVVDISRNINLLMAALASKREPFGDDGGSNSEIKSKEKSRDHEDSGKESRKESEKEQLSSGAMNPSQSLFKMKAKVDIKPYQGEIDALKLNHQL
jgi:hypothetical protein